ncbi:alpha/beta fold hydrolase [Amorphoplanes digitatis]|uniref:Pimeloyl-ACP methyl ester carboxylesterase n=1 Tax=Actinoplanes digitatis TaxID=1868 RepID=A0A7W7I181_9ACTN|nr:alpha/beta hydrolase [Actinoplanes digitatis]MBB4764608.1 pimeloyl-ACP methyl ester carboxylesterase [Actinoplanes digitatis]BFE74118.1 alpha/beta hydrolase [Actinoplanes digitatis]GID91442.1 hydrolase [Actinoplanes digitatis]
MAITPLGIAYDHTVGTNGLPIVLIHAGVADRRMWDPQWDVLGSEHDVVRLDLRGFGESTAAPQGSLSHVDDVLSTLSHLGVGRCHLVGSSLGAGVAFEVTLTAPQLVQSLLLCPPGGSLLAELTDDLKAFFDAEKSALAVGDIDAAVEANIASWVVGPRRDASQVDPGFQDVVRRMQRRAFEATASWADVDEVELNPPALDRLDEIKAPTLVLVGGHDLATTRDSADRVCAGLTQVRRVDWPDVAHLPSLEQPDRFLALLLDWVANHRD